MFKKSIRDGSLLYLGVILLIALCIAFLLPVTPEDYWWYMRIGRDTLSTGAIPAADTFTWTILGQPILYHSWGASVLFWLVYRAGGLTLTVFLRGLVVGITYSVLWFTARRAGAGRIGSSLVLLAAVLASSNNWSLRPQLLVYPLFALALWILYQWRAGKKKIVWWLPLIALIWGNLHASFVVLVALVGAALIFGKGDRRTLFFSFIGILAATFINPHSWRSWEYVVQMLTSSSNMQFSSEWGSPVNEGWQMNLFFFWFLIFPVLAATSERKLSSLEWVWFIGFGFLALWGMRYCVWFILILAVLTAELLSGWEKKWLPESKPGNVVLNWVLPLVFTLIPVLFLPGVREGWWQQAPEPTQNTPVRAVEWLQSHEEIQGPLLAEMGFASYLEFTLPERPIWIDTRVQLFPVSMWEDYREITLASQGWQPRLDGTGANLLMISPATQPKLARALAETKDWCKVYADEVAQIYTRGECGN